MEQPGTKPETFRAVMRNLVNSMAKQHSQNRCRSFPKAPTLEETKEPNEAWDDWTGGSNREA
jgi:hypothetical protein